MSPLTVALILALILALTAATLASAAWLRQRAIARDLGRRLDQPPTRGPADDPTRDTFLDLVTHELRSPLAAIIGYQELLCDGVYGQIGDAALEPLARIGRSAQHLLHLTDGIIDLAQLRTGPPAANVESLDLDPLVATVARDFSAYADERHLRHSLHVDPDLPRIRSDRDRLVRALHLLVVAAVKNPAGDHLEFRVERTSSGATVRIRGTRLAVHSHGDSPNQDAGIRLTVAAATADLLGGEIRNGQNDDDAVPDVVFVIRDVDPVAFDDTGR